MQQHLTDLCISNNMDLSCGTRACSGTVVWGTALQARRSQVRFPIKPLEFFTDLIHPAAYGPGVDPVSNTNEYQGYLMGDQAPGA
jgi:hypothetical protein